MQAWIEGKRCVEVTMARRELMCSGPTLLNLKASGILICVPKASVSCFPASIIWSSLQKQSALLHSQHVTFTAYSNEAIHKICALLLVYGGWNMLASLGAKLMPHRDKLIGQTKHMNLQATWAFCGWSSSLCQRLNYVLLKSVLLRLDCVLGLLDRVILHAEVHKDFINTQKLA